jgi:hypothetical protein
MVFALTGYDCGNVCISMALDQGFVVFVSLLLSSELGRHRVSVYV